MSLLERLVDQPSTSRPTHPARDRIMEGSWVLDVVPYTASADKNAHQFLPWFWQRLRDEGLIELYFPGMAETSFGEFASLFTAPGVKKLLFLLKDPSTLDNDLPTVVDCIGFATWSPMEWGGQQVGNCGFIFFRDYWDRATTVKGCHRAMQYWFHEMEPSLDVCLGLNPAGNVLVQRFLPKIGWTRVGQLPIPQYYDGKYSDMVVWYITRRQFDLNEEARKK